MARQSENVRVYATVPVVDNWRESPLKEILDRGALKPPYEITTDKFNSYKDSIELEDWLDQSNGVRKGEFLEALSYHVFNHIREYNLELNSELRRLNGAGFDWDPVKNHVVSIPIETIVRRAHKEIAKRMDVSERGLLGALDFMARIRVPLDVAYIHLKKNCSVTFSSSPQTDDQHYSLEFNLPRAMVLEQGANGLGYVSYQSIPLEYCVGITVPKKRALNVRGHAKVRELRLPVHVYKP